MTSLFVLLTPEPGVGIGDLDGQLCCPLHDQLPVLGGHVVSDLSTVSPTEVQAEGLIKDKGRCFVLQWFWSHSVQLKMSCRFGV